LSANGAGRGAVCFLATPFQPLIAMRLSDAAPSANPPTPCRSHAGDINASDGVPIQLADASALDQGAGAYSAPGKPPL